MPGAVLWFILLCYATLAASCRIQGHSFGECKASQDIQDQMPFCGSVVQYSACIPIAQPAFPNLTLSSKDAWLGKSFNDFVSRRQAIELGNLEPQDPSLYDFYTGSVVTRFGHSDCIDAYKNFLCYMNFPRCNEAGETMGLCTSVCENFFKACKYDKQLWRCYEPSYYGGKYPEGTQGDQVYVTGNPVFLRALFPGLPFIPNQFTPVEQWSEPVCTPSIDGGASSLSLGSLTIVLLSLLSFTGLYF